MYVFIKSNLPSGATTTTNDILYKNGERVK